MEEYGALIEVRTPMRALPMPLLAPILIACGIGELTARRECDAPEYRLHRLMEHDDILIDPDGATQRLAPPRTAPSLPHDLFDYGALVVPGLLGAPRGRGVAVPQRQPDSGAVTAPMHPERWMYRACTVSRSRSGVSRQDLVGGVQMSRLLAGPERAP